MALFYIILLHFARPLCGVAYGNRDLATFTEQALSDRSAQKDRTARDSGHPPTSERLSKTKKAMCCEFLSHTRFGNLNG